MQKNIKILLASCLTLATGNSNQAMVQSVRMVLSRASVNAARTVTKTKQLLVKHKSLSLVGAAGSLCAAYYGVTKQQITNGPAIRSSATEQQKKEQEFKLLVAPIVERAKELAAHHAQDPALPKPIIAISGGSGGGKSYFTNQLEALLKKEGIKVTTFRHDDFIQPELVPNTIGHSGFEPHAHFNHQRLHSVLQQILAGKECVRKPVWNRGFMRFMRLFKKPKREVTACFHDVDLILFEGIYTLTGSEAYNLLPYSSYRIFIDVPEDLMWQWNWERELKGHHPRTKEKFAADVGWDMDDYRNVVKPSEQNADFVIEKGPNHVYQQLRIV